MNKKNRRYTQTITSRKGYFMKTYKEQISCIIRVARYFATMDYHVTTTFYSQDGGCEVTIFFYDIKLKESIESYLRKHLDHDDSLTFNDFTREEYGTKFYTYKLQKHPS